MKKQSRILLAGALLLLFNQPVQAENHLCTSIGEVVSARGNLLVQHSGTDKWSSLRRKGTVCEGDTLKTSFRSRAAITLSNQTTLRIKQQTTTQLTNFTAQSEVRSVMRLISGVIHFFSRKPQEYSIATNTATIGIRGTEFVVSANDETTDVTVFDGEVIAENDVSPVNLGAGNTVSLSTGRSASVQTLVNPREQVQWGIYYPPLLALNDDASASLQQAGDCAHDGNFECAFDLLDNLAQSERNSETLVFQASLLLAVGEVEQAQQLISEASKLDAGNASALALSAIIALSQTHLEQAVTLADQAIATDSNSIAALIARSYVQQAMLDLAGAGQTLINAVEIAPTHALAWARLSELWLAQGYLDKARSAAQQAVALEPNLARTQMVLGYAALSEIDSAGAIKAFETALELDSADPMAQLGLGLALIRSGKLAEGRRHIEAAVALDSNSAILRPYLGRAYYEEKRAPLDAEQYNIAKQLDPNDPTAYLFDALRKHSENQPIEAVQDLRQSITLNDNRAVYRGRNALDQDRAARAASLARIYDTLGFGKQGINEATQSLGLDPANASAHRFLADSYGKIRRHEISRVSELLQAQMLQDINMNPVQPSVSATNLNIGSGTGTVGLNEFTDLFDKNGAQPALSLQSGSNDTRAVEAVLSGVRDSLSYSLGGFDYQTDGWRANNAQDQQLADLYLQWSASPRLNLQAEISSRESSEGDLAFNVDPQDFDSTLKIARNLDTQRIGLRYSATPDSDFLLSHISTERDEHQTYDDFVLIPNPAFPGCFPCPPFLAVPGSLDIGRNDEGNQNEAQYLHDFGRVRMVAGISEADVDSSFKTVTMPSSILEQESRSSLTQSRSYLYSIIDVNKNLQLTLAVSRDDYEEVSTDLSETNSKLGLSWRPDQRQTIRLASFEVMKPALVNNRTLEPTQIAGFNQFFDDINATRTSRDGIAYDLKINPAMAVGIELSEREMKEPVVTDVGSGPVTVFEDREEEYHRMYFNWTASESIAVSAEAIYDLYRAAPGIATQDDNLPERVRTNSLPISVKYFSPSGWFAGVTATRVEQKVVRNPSPFAASPQASGEDSFDLLDLSVGYRLNKRRGAISLSVLNITDEQFSYQDDSYREFRDEPSIGPYFPETTVNLHASLVF